MDPINYMPQGIDPVARALEGYAQGRGLVQQNADMAAQARGLDQTDRQLGQRDVSLGMEAERLQMAQMAQQQEAAAQAEQEAQAKQLQDDLAAITENPNAGAEDYAKLAARNPGMSQAIMGQWDTLNDARKENDISFYSQVYSAIDSGNDDIARDMIDRRVKASKASGMDDVANEAELLLEYMTGAPDFAQTLVGAKLAIVGGDKVTEVLDGGRDKSVQQGDSIGDGSVMTMLMNDGTPRIVETATGRVLEGVEAEEARQRALDGKIKYETDLNAARQGGRNLANIDTGGDAAAAVETGKLDARAEGIGPVNEAAALGTARGARIGAAESELAEMERNMPGLRVVVDQLYDLSNTATYTQAGQLRDEARKQLGLPAGEGAVARAEYIAVVDNQVLPLLRQTFGAAFTAKEGESLRATLGDPNKSPDEKRAVLRAFIAQKERDLAARQGGNASDTARAVSDDVLSQIDELNRLLEGN